MRSIVLGLALLALVIAAVGAAPSVTPALAADRSANRGTATPAGKPSVTWDDYRLIVDRNIFLRDRNRPSIPRTGYTPSPSSRAPDPQMILFGVADQDGALMAFFEDDQTGQTVKLQIGQRIRGGSIVGLSLDGVDYQTAAGIRRVGIGQTLSGATATPASTFPASGTSATTSPALGTSASSAPSDSAATQTAGPASGTGDKAADDVAERMRQRRLAELGVTKAPSSSQPTTQDSNNAGSSSGPTPASSPSSSPSLPISTGSSGS